MPKRTALIDGDIYIFRAALGAEQPIQWDEDLWTLHAHMSIGMSLLDEMINTVAAEVKADHVIVALSDVRNFRYDVYPLYKHNRKDKRPPMLRTPLKEYVLSRYETFLRPGLEGDDVLGILSTSPHIVRGEKVVVSCDKDMRTIPGILYDSDKKIWSEISENEADYWHLTQTLTGDTADGYPGCPGIGPKKAENILLTFRENACSLAEAWEMVVGAYERAKLTELDALIQARIARICRRDDYNFQSRKVNPWYPPKPAPSAVPFIEEIPAG